MSEPEIARRCPSCGASIREKAFFCPQCGQEMNHGVHDAGDSLHDTHDIVRDVTLTESDFQSLKAPRPKSSAKKATPAHVDTPGEKPVDKLKAPVAQRARGEVGARIQRATTKARDVEGNVAQRVQKFREISSVMIDEAAYDPSLRFVLVAGVLFLLFLLIVVLNRLIS